MSIFTKQVESLDYSDIEELLRDRATENVRLEFKRETPGRDEMLKKICSFANTYGGHIVIGVEQDTKARASALTGVPIQPGFRQQVVQWCYDAIFPPVTPVLSPDIQDPFDRAKFYYVIFVPQSDTTPHFINGRRGCYIRTDEYSQRFEPRLATYEEIAHLAQRRAASMSKREEIIARARVRFNTHAQQNYSQRQGVVGNIDLTMWMALVPLFPPLEPFEVSALDEAITSIRLPARQMSFPSGEPIAQMDGFFFPDPRVLNFAYLEADTHGLIFYSEELGRITPDAQAKPATQPPNPLPEPADIYIYATWILAWVLFYTRYAGLVYARLGYDGPLIFRLGLDRIQGRQVRIPLDRHGNEFDQGRPLLDEAIVVERRLDTRRLQTDIRTLGKELFRAVTFACGWRRAYSATEEFVDQSIDYALGYLMWHPRDIEPPRPTPQAT